MFHVFFYISTKGYGKTTNIRQNGEGIHLDVMTGEIKFPTTLDLEIVIDDDERVISKAERTDQTSTEVNHSLILNINYFLFIFK